MDETEHTGRRQRWQVVVILVAGIAIAAAIAWIFSMVGQIMTGIFAR
jgi:hypothetical protein